MDTIPPQLHVVRDAHVSLVRDGIRIDGVTYPMRAGSVHYWRLDPADWREALVQTKSLGVPFIDLYVPWGVHEIEPGRIDTGEIDPALDVGRFLSLIQELGMFAIVRPGPHINAELTFFGIPERIIWDPLCQARSPEQNPVMLPMLPVSFPVPSYASETFLGEVDRWFALIAKALVPFAYPNGPMVLLQVDNEGALYFRDGVYDQDYRPEAIEVYRAFVRGKYGNDAALRRAYGKETLELSTLDPPTRLTARSAEELVAHLDWAEFQEYLLATAMRRMARSLASAGLGDLPTIHNFPMGQEATPLNAALIGDVIDLIGFDFYHRASPRDHSLIARRTTELVARCDGIGKTPFASEMGAGFPPFFPIMDERDSAFTVMCALAYGLRGYNIYMAVERDRWIGAPIDPHGRRRPFAKFWEDLGRGLDRAHFHRLHRPCPVRLVIPRSQQRMARVLHAFAPLTPAFFALIGATARESCMEDTFGMEQSGLFAAEEFVHHFDHALNTLGVPFAYVGGESIIPGLRDARWVICSNVGGLESELHEALLAANHEGVRITLGPFNPSREGNLLPLTEPYDNAGFQIVPDGGTVSGFSSVAAEAIAAQAIRELGIATVEVEPSQLFATLHVDARGVPRVLFLINPTPTDADGRIDPPLARKLTDLLNGAEFTRTGGHFRVNVLAKSVRMLHLEVA